MYNYFFKILFTAFSFILVICSSVFAANPLGFEIGKAKYSDVKRELSDVVHLKNMGINKYSGGRMVVADNPELLGYDGLQKVTLVFDHKNILTAVVMKLSKGADSRRDGGFMYAYERLSEKYLPVFKNLQTTGRMTAGFTTPTRDVHIRMMSSGISDVFDLQYLSNSFWQRYEANKATSKDIQNSVQYTGLVKNNLF